LRKKDLEKGDELDLKPFLYSGSHK